MNPLFIAPILEIGKGIINRLFPDPAAATAAQLELLKMQQNAAFAYSYVLLPTLQFFVFTFGTATMVEQLAKAPALELSEMMPVLLGMLGLSGLRTTERIKGVVPPQS